MISADDPVSTIPRLRGLLHRIAAYVFPPLGVALIVLAPTVGARLATAIYTAGVTAMYAVSAAYHRGRWSPRARQRLRRLDHTMILVAIAASYTPIAAIGLGGTAGWVVLAVVWSLSVVGAVVRNVWADAPGWVTGVVYLGVGWVAVGVLPLLWQRLGWGTFTLVVLGGVLYTLGAIVFGWRRPDPAPATFGYHEMFHAFVVGAGVVVYIAVATVVLAR